MPLTGACARSPSRALALTACGVELAHPFGATQWLGFHPYQPEVVAQLVVVHEPDLEYGRHAEVAPVPATANQERMSSI